MTHASAPLQTLSAAETVARLPFAPLVDAIAQAARDQAAGRITSPERLVVPLGEGGVILSMPAAASDLGVHKLVTVQPANGARGLPAIHGLVTVLDAATGRPLLLLDGPEVTGRRTAAVSLLALRTLLPAPPRAVLLVGTGVQAVHHVRALQALLPQARVLVRGSSPARAEAFCAAHAGDHPGLAPCPAGPVPDMVDAVVLLTTATEPVYDEAPRAGRLVIGAGAFKPTMAEIGPRTLAGSQLFADDPAGARHEAGDLLRAGVDWNLVRSLAEALDRGVDLSRPVVFKSVGCAAWDLAAARVAMTGGG